MRPPDFVIGDPPYLLRWYLIPRNRFFNVYLHKFLRSDDDRALHDHPWLFNMSILVQGRYREHRLNKKTKQRHRFLPVLRWGKAPHRVELESDWDYDQYADKLTTIERPCSTIFITGPVVRDWGFYCKHGWIHWKKFVEVREGGNKVGAGCDDGKP